MTTAERELIRGSFAVRFEQAQRRLLHYIRAHARSGQGHRLARLWRRHDALLAVARRRWDGR